MLLIAVAASVGVTMAVQSAPAVEASPNQQTAAEDSTPTPRPASSERWFMKYDGVDGESKDANHDKWIDVLSIDWGANKPGGGATGQSRRRGGAVVEDFAITFEYEKASPKLLEAAATGKVFPKVEIELSSTYGGARATYLKYELTNVQISSYNVSGSTGDDAPPTVTVGNNFEEIKVTYTEYDDTGSTKGNAETTWKVEKGEK